MFDKWKQWKIAGSVIVVAAILIFAAANIRIRSVDAYKKEQADKIAGESMTLPQDHASQQEETSWQEMQKPEESTGKAAGETSAAAENSSKSSQAATTGKHATISVKLQITCASAAKIRDTIKNPGLRDKIPENGIILEKTAYRVPEGCSVYELLSSAALANHISITASADKSYVTGINSLSQMMLSQQSGWKYCVNGEIPGRAAKAYILQDGDEVEWFYVLSANERES